MPLSPTLSFGMVALALAMAGVFVFAAWCPEGTPRERTRWALVALAVAAVYLGGSAALAASGALSDVDARPPAAGLMLIGLSVGMAALAFSGLGDRLLAWPLAWLVGAQAFRIVVELWLSAAYAEGAVPAEVT
ncbi:hypothetical protein [Rubrivirga sp. IMCC45206]|uniref:hypothetical protein n=1 Tax=Rubrivirga sp. IMCC45206 TaxID=3391614 RepID=UPI0039900B93